MKSFILTLNLVICFELILGTMPVSLNHSTAIAQEQCPSGLSFDSTLNRCITSDQQASIINATASCNGDRECYKRIAEEELKKAVAEGKIEDEVKNKSGLFNKAMGIAAIIGPLTIGVLMLVKKQASNTCAKISMYAMMGAAAALLAGNLLADKGHKKRLKKIKDDWEAKKNTAEGKTEGQSEAFEMMAKQEDSMAKAASSKATFYTVAFAAFTASAVTALMEAFMPDKGLCKDTPASASLLPDQINDLKNLRYQFQAEKNLYSAKSFEDYIMLSQELATGRTPSIEEYEKIKKTTEWHPLAEMKAWSVTKEIFAEIKNQFTIGSAQAQAETVVEEIVVTGVRPAPLVIDVAPLNLTTPPDLTSLLKIPDLTPPKPPFYARAEVRAAISGVFAGWSFMMMSHAKKQAKVAKNRAEFLRKMKQEFADSQNAISCTAEERKLSANANCYCYTADGKRDPSKGNSQVCQQLFTGKTLAQAGNYDMLDGTNQRVCVTQSGAIDEKCSCKATKNCGTTLSGSSVGFDATGLNMVTAGLKPANDFMNGNVGAGQIDAASANSAAIKLLDQKSKLENKLTAAQKNEQKKAGKDFENSLITSARGLSVPQSSGPTISSNMTPSQAAAALEKELKDTGSDFEKINGSPALAQPGNSAVDDAGFVIETPTAAESTDAQVAEVMATELDYGQSDITQTNTNLFDIVSNRYQRSGMKRLFEEPVKAEADKK